MKAMEIKIEKHTRNILQSTIPTRFSTCCFRRRENELNMLEIQYFYPEVDFFCVGSAHPKFCVCQLTIGL